MPNAKKWLWRVKRGAIFWENDASVLVTDYTDFDYDSPKKKNVVKSQMKGSKPIGELRIEMNEWDIREFVFDFGCSAFSWHNIIDVLRNDIEILGG